MDATEILPSRLWIGTAMQASNISFVERAKIGAVLNVRETKQMRLQGVRSIWIPLMDGPNNDPLAFGAAVETLERLMRDKVPTLVHCAVGVSRSPCVTATWWAKDEGIPFDRAADTIERLRPCVMIHPALRKLARQYLGEIEPCSPQMT